MTRLKAHFDTQVTIHQSITQHRRSGAERSKESGGGAPIPRGSVNPPVIPSGSNHNHLSLCRMLLIRIILPFVVLFFFKSTALFLSKTEYRESDSGHPLIQYHRFRVGSTNGIIMETPITPNASSADNVNVTKVIPESPLVSDTESVTIPNHSVALNSPTRRRIFSLNALMLSRAQSQQHPNYSHQSSTKQHSFKTDDSDGF